MTPEAPETTLEDFRRLFVLAAERGWQWLVVGGHAVNFWARFFLPKRFIKVFPTCVQTTP
jgi:hypothetical protein